MHAIYNNNIFSKLCFTFLIVSEVPCAICILDGTIDGGRVVSSSTSLVLVNIVSSSFKSEYLAINVAISTRGLRGNSLARALSMTAFATNSFKSHHLTYSYVNFAFFTRHLRAHSWAQTLSAAIFAARSTLLTMCLALAEVEVVVLLDTKAIQSILIPFVFAS